MVLDKAEIGSLLVPETGANLGARIDDVDTTRSTLFLTTLSLMYWGTVAAV
jgi:hypothetical protein